MGENRHNTTPSQQQILILQGEIARMRGVLAQAAAQTKAAIEFAQVHASIIMELARIAGVPFPTGEEVVGPKEFDAMFVEPLRAAMRELQELREEKRTRWEAEHDPILGLIDPDRIDQPLLLCPEARPRDD